MRIRAAFSPGGTELAIASLKGDWSYDPPANQGSGVYLWNVACPGRARRPGSPPSHPGGEESRQLQATPSGFTARS